MAIFDSPEGSTPIDDISGLIPGHISVKRELDEWESENILFAVRKHLSVRKDFELSEKVIKSIHKDMFDFTWNWAGLFRKKTLNIGVKPEHITIEIKKMIDDYKFWKTHKMALLEQSVRIHHRLVKIHPFENGNGRHARLVADIMLYNANHPMPNWPDKKMIDNSNIRKDYINALKSADNGDYNPLTEFTSGLLD